MTVSLKLIISWKTKDSYCITAVSTKNIYKAPWLYRKCSASAHLLLLHFSLSSFVDPWIFSGSLEGCWETAEVCPHPQSDLWVQHCCKRWYLNCVNKGTIPRAKERIKQPLLHKPTSDLVSVEGCWECLAFCSCLLFPLVTEQQHNKNNLMVCMKLYSAESVGALHPWCLWLWYNQTGTWGAAWPGCGRPLLITPCVVVIPGTVPDTEEVGGKVGMGMPPAM